MLEVFISLTLFVLLFGTNNCEQVVSTQHFWLDASLKVMKGAEDLVNRRVVVSYVFLVSLRVVEWLRP